MLSEFKRVLFSKQAEIERKYKKLCSSVQNESNNEFRRGQDRTLNLAKEFCYTKNGLRIPKLKIGSIVNDCDLGDGRLGTPEYFPNSSKFSKNRPLRSIRDEPGPLFSEECLIWDEIDDYLQLISFQVREREVDPSLEFIQDSVNFVMEQCFNSADAASALGRLKQSEFRAEFV